MVESVVVAFALVVELVYSCLVVKAGPVEEVLLVGVALRVLELSEVQVVSRCAKEAVGVNSGCLLLLRGFGRQVVDLLLVLQDLVLSCTHLVTNLMHIDLVSILS